MNARDVALTSLSLGIVVAVLTTQATAQLASQAFEETPVLWAADILPPEVRQSGNHRVEDQVTLEGDMLVFEIESDYGIYRVESLPMLLVRTHELRVLAQAIGQYKAEDHTLAEELRGQLTYDADSLVDVVKAPFSMASQLASNIGKTAKEFQEIGSPHHDTGKDRYVDSVASDVISGSHKRNIAYQLDLDPYSTNPKVQEFLNTVAKARSSGHFKAGVATVRVPRSRMVAVSGGRLDAEVKVALKSLTPIELNEGIGEQLRQIGVDAETARRFLTHPDYSPRHKTSITAHLDYLRGVGRREVLIRAALAARGEAGALSFEVLARMLAYYHESVTALAEMRLLGKLPVAVTREGRMVVLMPVDYILWNRQSEQLFSSLGEKLSSEGYVQSEIVLGGSFSEAARSGVASRGFDYRERFFTSK